MQFLFLFVVAIILNSRESKGLEADTDLGSCPEGWVNGQSLGCFKFLQDTLNVNWMEAQYLCETEGGYLAEPTTHQFIDMLSLLASIEQDLTGITFWWIGLSDVSHEGSWIWTHTNQGARETFWREGSPKTTTANNQDCVLMEFLDDTLTWIDVDCLMVSLELAPVCQPEMRTSTTAETTPIQTTTTTNSWNTTTSWNRTTTTTLPLVTNTTTLWPTSTTASCKLGWSHFDGKCFRAVLETMDWVSAREFCTAEGGELASIHSTEENDFIKILIKAAFGYSTYVWVGGTDSETEGSWQWSDGTEWNYQDNSFHVAEDVGENCLLLDYMSAYYTWLDSSCFVEYGFLCSV